jgi:UDP-3-O-[3-hydroxymyristoyl] glucosamine N-acyltransferase
MLTAGEVAARVGARVIGDAGRRLAAVAPIETAGPEDLAFVANPRYAGHLATTRAGAVIVAPAHLPAEGGDRTWLVADDAYLAFARALALFHPARRPAPGVHPTAWVDPGATVAAQATVGPLCSVGAGSRIAAGAWLVAGVHVGEDVEVGEGSTLHPNVTVYAGSRIGRRVTLHGGTTIGADGFGFARTPQGAVKVPQVGRVVLEDDVEIGANCAVDRATLGETRIGRGVKVDNLVQIGHNVRVGEGTVIVAQAGISGSTRIGRGVTIAGQAGVVGHVEVADGAIVTAQTGVSSDVPAKAVVSGSPHIPHNEWRRAVAAFADLPGLRQRVRALERRLGIGRPAGREAGADAPAEGDPGE